MRPALWLLFDGTDSMGIADDLAESERAPLADAVGLRSPAPGAADRRRSQAAPHRIRQVVARKGRRRTALAVGQEVSPAGVSVRSAQRRPDAGIVGRRARREIDAKRLASQLTTSGKVTAPWARRWTTWRRLRHDQSGGLGGVQRFPAELRAAAGRGRQAAGRAGAHGRRRGPTATVDVAVELRAPVDDEKGRTLGYHRDGAAAGVRRPRGQRAVFGPAVGRGRRGLDRRGVHGAFGRKAGDPLSRRAGRRVPVRACQDRPLYARRRSGSGRR